MTIDHRLVCLFVCLFVLFGLVWFGLVSFVCLFVFGSVFFFDGDFHRGDVTVKQVYKLHDLWGGGDGVILRMSKNKLGFLVVCRQGALRQTNIGDHRVKIHFRVSRHFVFNSHSKDGKMHQVTWMTHS